MSFLAEFIAQGAGRLAGAMVIVAVTSMAQADSNATEWVTIRLPGSEYGITAMNLSTSSCVDVAEKVAHEGKLMAASCR